MILNISAEMTTLKKEAAQWRERVIENQSQQQLDDASKVNSLKEYFGTIFFVYLIFCFILIHFNVESIQ